MAHQFTRVPQHIPQNVRYPLTEITYNPTQQVKQTQQPFSFDYYNSTHNLNTHNKVLFSIKRKQQSITTNTNYSKSQCLKSPIQNVIQINKCAFPNKQACIPKIGYHESKVNNEIPLPRPSLDIRSNAMSSHTKLTPKQRQDMLAEIDQFFKPTATTTDFQCIRFTEPNVSQRSANRKSIRSQENRLTVALQDHSFVSVNSIENQKIIQMEIQNPEISKIINEFKNKKQSQQDQQDQQGIIISENINNFKNYTNTMNQQIVQQQPQSQVNDPILILETQVEPQMLISQQNQFVNDDLTLSQTNLFDLTQDLRSRSKVEGFHSEVKQFSKNKDYNTQSIFDVSKNIDKEIEEIRQNNLKQFKYSYDDCVVEQELSSIINQNQLQTQKEYNILRQDVQRKYETEIKPNLENQNKSNQIKPINLQADIVNLNTEEYQLSSIRNEQDTQRSCENQSQQIIQTYANQSLGKNITSKDNNNENINKFCQKINLDNIKLVHQDQVKDVQHSEKNKVSEFVVQEQFEPGKDINKTRLISDEKDQQSQSKILNELNESLTSRQKTLTPQKTNLPETTLYKSENSGIKNPGQINFEQSIEQQITQTIQQSIDGQVDKLDLKETLENITKTVVSRVLDELKLRKESKQGSNEQFSPRFYLNQRRQQIKSQKKLLTIDLKENIFDIESGIKQDTSEQSYQHQNLLNTQSQQKRNLIMQSQTVDIHIKAQTLSPKFDGKSQQVSVQQISRSYSEFDPKSTRKQGTIDIQNDDSFIRMMNKNLEERDFSKNNYHNLFEDDDYTQNINKNLYEVLMDDKYFSSQASSLVNIISSRKYEVKTQNTQNNQNKKQKIQQQRSSNKRNTSNNKNSFNKSTNNRSVGSFKPSNDFLNRVENDIKQRSFKINMKLEEKKIKETLDEKQIQEYNKEKERMIKQRMSKQQETHNRLFQDAHKRKERQQSKERIVKEKQVLIQQIMSDRRIMNNLDKYIDYQTTIAKEKCEVQDILDQILITQQRDNYIQEKI